ncbi:alpha/beta hydrolase [Nocardia sp. NPDC051833]|uniref:alpha/beta fold hydrolase n=1 Tax=Nocardia sp. NPDC051833 TaxID=3155674 RepID=UPI0034137A7E
MNLTGRPVDVHAPDGTRLHTRVFGASDAPPIVLVHGVLCRIEFWQHQIEELAEHFRVIAFDLRGHGASAAPRVRHYRLDDLAGDLDAVLDATLNDGETAVLAGHSLGGIAILAWARRFPAHVAARAGAVALINTTPGDVLRHVDFLPFPARYEPIRWWLARLGARMTRMPTPRRIPFRHRLVARLAVGPGAPAAIAHTVADLAMTTSARGRRGYGVMLVELTETIDVAGLSVPALVIASTHDRITPPGRSVDMAGALPHLVDLVELAGGHSLPLEQPAYINTALAALRRATDSLTESPALPVSVEENRM